MFEARWIVLVSIYRYNPETDKKPYMQDFEIDTQGKDFMVFDILEKINFVYEPDILTLFTFSGYKKALKSINFTYENTF